MLIYKFWIFKSSFAVHRRENWYTQTTAVTPVVCTLLAYPFPSQYSSHYAPVDHLETVYEIKMYIC